MVAEEAAAAEQTDSEEEQRTREKLRWPMEMALGNDGSFIATPSMVEKTNEQEWEILYDTRDIKTHEMMITSVELEAGQDVVVDGISLS
jgi:hypothetical protein